MTTLYIINALNQPQASKLDNKKYIFIINERD